MAKLKNIDSISRQMTNDTFVNFAAKLGIGTQNLSSANTYNFNPVSRNRTLIEWMYRGSWICGVAVDCVADDMTREGLEFSSQLEVEQAEKLQEAIRVKQIWQSLNQVGKWARLYGGSCGYIDIEGQDPSTPLRVETVGPKQFRGIISMDRWMLNPDPLRGIESPGPNFGLPEFYQTVASSYSFPFPSLYIHHTRMVRMEGIELPYWQKVAENMWGISVLERIYDRLTAFDSTTTGAAQLVFKSYLRTYKVENLREIIAAGGPAFEALTKQIELIRAFQSIEGMTLMDATDTFEALTYSFGGLADVLNSMAEQIAGATQVPVARLFGQSPGGMNSTGDHELRTYYDNIVRQQERWFRRPLDVILRVLAQSEGIELPEGFTYEFKSLWQLTDDEKSTIDRNDTDSVLAAIAGGLISQQVGLKELRSRGKATGRWQNITDKDINAAEDEVPSPQEMMEAQAGGAEGEAEKTDLKDKPEIPSAPAGANDALSMMDVGGLPVHIETHKGAYRTGGKGAGAWKTLMPAHYGYIEGVGSAEGMFEQLDCYVGDHKNAFMVHVIDQHHPDTGEFDEHKCMLQFPTKQVARDTYINSFSDGKGEKRIGAITSVPMKAFKDWMKGGDLHKPFAAKLAAIAAE